MSPFIRHINKYIIHFNFTADEGLVCSTMSTRVIETVHKSITEVKQDVALMKLTSLLKSRHCCSYKISKF